MSDLSTQRRYFAEELEAICDLRTPRLVDAFARVQREDYLTPGPWLVRSESDYLTGPPRQTPDSDVRRLYHNVAVAIDPSRLLFNGAPSLIGTCIDRLALAPGQRVLHVGCGLGYYTAVMADCVGPGGRVVAVEVDDGLALQARRNLQPLPQVSVRAGDARELGGESFDAILINAGVTHPLDQWLDSLVPGGRMVLPLTATMPSMGPIGKGPLLLLTRREADFAARFVTVVAIYSAVGIRDAAMNERIGKALMRGHYPVINRLRRNPHDESSGCWLHAPGFCLGA